jgi:uncharacterized protein YbbC (DUF1343 family)
MKYMKCTFKQTFFLVGSVIFTGELFSSASHNKVRLGIESITKKIVSHHAKLSNPKVGLITNQTGRIMQGDTTVRVLQKKGINVVKIFAPEHGYSGTVPAGHDVKNTFDSTSGVSVTSLYTHGRGKTITAKQLDEIDMLIFDIQDCGMRHYTYISSLYKVMEACKDFSKPLIVCDRPNPLGGNMEGPLVEPSLQSFISIASIPLRHGMTIGELALYFNGRLFDNKVSLYVVALKNYTRNKEDFIFLAPLSPNLPTLASLYGYSFLGLLGEVKPFKVGVGTTSAFQRLELPINVKQSSVFFKNVENALQKMQIPVKKIQYTNQKSKKYIGLQFLLDHTVSWSTMELLVLIFQEAKKGNIPLTFSPSFNKAFGSDLLQKAVQESKIDAHVLQAIKKQTEQFYKQAKKFFLYKPYPQLVHTDR